MNYVILKGQSEPIRVGKIVCLGRNYVDHIKELGNEIPSSPVIFIKPASSIILSGEQIRIPDYSSDCHHEVELAVLIGKTGRHLTEAEAMNVVAGYGVAIDLTLRDVQSRLKVKGLPWEIAKGFDTACPLSNFVPATEVDDPHQLQLTIKVNGETRQDGNTRLMMRTIPRFISEVSAIFTLQPGDILLTGTPAGVSRILSGDQIEAEIEQVGCLEVSVA
jgi:2-keto-4-pentenoate hydratase/2-oxohepta-3-ene-1,7-dioic acid hydratase in catechol pathway